jgi:hypothetical protein
MKNLNKLIFRILVAVLLTVSLLLGKETEVSFIPIHLQNQSREIIRKIAELNLDITNQNPVLEYIEAIVTRTQYSSLRNSEIPTEQIISDLPKFVE